jgi:hypothetical protein
MFRILRYGVLAAVCAVPFALPQASQAARPARYLPYRAAGRYCAPYHHHYWHGHRHWRR